VNRRGLIDWKIDWKIDLSPVLESDHLKMNEKKLNCLRECIDAE
jgi:hypothetical protein